MLASRIAVDESGCWLWTGAVTAAGYGQIELRENGQRRPWLAHRLVAKLLGYPLGENMHHRETCPKRCVHPEHLTPMTVADHASHHTDEFCKAGHPLADAMIVKRGNGRTSRMCRQCMSDRARKRRENWTPEQRLADSRARNARRK
jgi:hypothetical protein